MSTRDSQGRDPRQLPSDDENPTGALPPRPPIVPPTPAAPVRPASAAENPPAAVVPPHLQGMPTKPAEQSAIPPDQSPQPPFIPATPAVGGQPATPTVPVAIPQSRQAVPRQSAPRGPVVHPVPPQPTPVVRSLDDATNHPAAATITADARAGEPTDEPTGDEPTGDWRAQAIELVSQLAIQSAPPWAVSMAVHLVVLIVLALVVFRPQIKSPFIVEVSYAEELGDQMLDDTQFMESIEPLEVDPAVSFDDKAVDDPLAATPQVDIKLELFNAPADMTAPSIGLALSGREKGAKQALLAAYGGTGETENSVKLALQWLKRNQQKDGSWSLAGPYADGVQGSENRLAATAMALLALQGAGNTHRNGEFSDAVKKAKDVLLRMQDGDGSFFSTQRLEHQHQLYSQGQATIAICELYGMTKDPDLREPAQRALDYAVSIQANAGNGGGGWRYEPGRGVDTSVTGWFVMALQSGKMAQLNVSQAALDKVARFLDTVSEDGIRYGYRPGETDRRISMTAEALLCREYLGWDHDDARLLAGVRLINEQPVDWDQPNIYYWYYATQVAHHMGGDAWDEWNQTMRKAVPKAQVKTGREKGSWSASGDPFGYRGGRLYATCFCVYMLEVYYRHLPIYRH